MCSDSFSNSKTLVLFISILVPSALALIIYYIFRCSVCPIKGFWRRSFWWSITISHIFHKFKPELLLRQSIFLNLLIFYYVFHLPPNICRLFYLLFCFLPTGFSSLTYSLIDFLMRQPSYPFTCSMNYVPQHLWFHSHYSLWYLSFFHKWLLAFVLFPICTAETISCHFAAITTLLIPISFLLLFSLYTDHVCHALLELLIAPMFVAFSTFLRLITLFPYTFRTGTTYYSCGLLPCISMLYS